MDYRIDSTKLADKIDEVLIDTQLRQSMGDNSFAVLKQNQGALQRLLNVIDNTISSIGVKHQ